MYRKTRRRCKNGVTADCSEGRIKDVNSVELHQNTLYEFSDSHCLPSDIGYTTFQELAPLPLSCNWL
jgi:hypothetical protein